MCGGGGGGGSNEALEYQKQQDRTRRARIQQGMEKINDFFNGYTSFPERKAAQQRVYDTIQGGGVPDFLQDEAARYNKIMGQEVDPYAGIPRSPVPSYANPYGPSTGSRAWPGLLTGARGDAASQRVENLQNAGFDDLQYGSYVPAYRPSFAASRNTGYWGHPAGFRGTRAPETYAEYLGQTIDSPEAFKEKYWDDFLDANDFQGVEHPGFDTSFYNQRAQAYEDFATPQLQRQYEEAQKAMQLGLIGQGLAGSSVAAERQANLERKNREALQGIAQQGQGYANKARQQIANQRQQLVNALQASADPSVVNSAALSRFDNIARATPEFAALGDVFGSLTPGFAGYTAGKRQRQAQQDNSDLFKLPGNYTGSGTIYS